MAASGERGPPTRNRAGAGMKTVFVALGVAIYAVFFATFLYAVGFVGDLLVPKTIDSGATGAVASTIAIDLALMTVFALQHSVMARPAFKRAWTKVVPQALERSVYVLLASLALMLLFWQWRPLPAMMWAAPSGAARWVIWALFWIGWATVLLSTFLINHFDLFGLKQVWEYRRAGVTPPPEFRTPLFYRVVRHPLYLGFVVAFWAAPTMTMGRLLFAAATTAYILVAIQLEERDLTAVFGDRYRDYRRRVSMLLPLPRFGAGAR